MNALSRWFNEGDLGEVSTTVEIDRRSIIYLAITTIVVTAIILFMIKLSK